ncbi:MAG TPA: 30S ribosomal protein S9, partial [Candidatus Woesearchaeota archaeon]|nr:30S ribosomal protein S9 [Candidatus Woesearchaeota archaeon]
MKNIKTIHEVGKRKKAIARATLKEGKGIVRINSQELITLPPNMYRRRIEEPLILSGETLKKVNINVNVTGGGVNGQADAIRLAIAKALAAYDKKLHKQFLNYDRT